MICLPISRDQKREGIISSCFPSPEGPPEEQVQLLNIVATEIAAAADGARLPAIQMAAIYAVEDLGQAEQDLSDLLQQVLDTTLTCWGAPSGAILLYDKDDEVWHHLIDHRVRDLCQCAQPEPAPVPCLDQLSGVGPEGVDRQLARSFFWFTGHRLVYFWLLPAHISWHAMLPKQAGGRLFSHPLACLSFWLFLALSVPLGFHHSTPIREWRLAGSWCMRS